MMSTFTKLSLKSLGTRFVCLLTRRFITSNQFNVRLDTAENWKLKLKTEKHCSKIIFKCVNNIVRPIFNEKVDKKWYLWVCEQCTNALFTVEKVSLYCWKQKKEAEMRFAPRRGRKTRKPNIAIFFGLFLIPIDWTVNILTFLGWYIENIHISHFKDLFEVLN